MSKQHDYRADLSKQKIFVLSDLNNLMFYLIKESTINKSIIYQNLLKLLFIKITYNFCI